MRYFFLGVVVIAGLGSSYLVNKVRSELADGSMMAVATEPEAPPSKVRPPGGRKVAIPADASGHYFASAVVNGKSLRVVVDTGATDVALTSETAKRLGLKIDVSEFTTMISTANGTVWAADVILKEIRIGSISIQNVGAIVVPGDALDVNLLGMSFLNRLRKFEVGGGQLVLMD